MSKNSYEGIDSDIVKMVKRAAFKAVGRAGIRKEDVPDIEQLPIAVMTVKEMRQFAQKVAMDCILIAAIPNMTPKDIMRVIKDRYDLPT